MNEATKKERDELAVKHYHEYVDKDEENATNMNWIAPRFSAFCYGFDAGKERIIETDCGNYPPRFHEAKFIAESRSLLPKQTEIIKVLRDALIEASKGVDYAESKSAREALAEAEKIAGEK